MMGINSKVSMKSQIKQKLEGNAFKEESALENNIKPTTMPKKTTKNEISSILTSNSSLLLNNTSIKEGRLKAYHHMKKGVMNKTEITALARVNQNNELLTTNPYQGQGNQIVIINEGGTMTESSNERLQKKANLNLVNQFEEYYKEKFKPIDTNDTMEMEMGNIRGKDSPEDVNGLYEVKLSYALGANINSGSACAMCFHKTDKWVAYVSQNLTIVEKFSEDKNRKQIILKDSSAKLSCVKLSENGKILMSYSTEKLEKKGEVKIKENHDLNLNDTRYIYPCIIFYEYSPIHETKFTKINKCVLKHNTIIDCEISHHNNMCLVLSSNRELESFISVLDFFHNEILITTAMNTRYISIKWNIYLTNLEFCTYSRNLLTFWRVNSSDVSLQYQHGDLGSSNLENVDGNTQESFYFSCMEYSPPVSVQCIVLVLLGVSTGEIWGVDTKTNCLVIKYTREQVFGNDHPASFSANRIISSISYITLIISNTIKVVKLPSLREIKYEELNIFANKSDNIVLDSEIYSYDMDTITPQGDAIALTKKGSLFYINLQDKCGIRLFQFIDEKSPIIQCKIIHKDSQFYSLRKIEYSDSTEEKNGMMLEDVSNEITRDNYFVITAHKNGNIKIWTVPEYQILYNFETVNEEIVCFDTTPNDLKLAVSYSTGYVRFFDITREKFLGKFGSQSLCSTTYFKFIRFLPDSQYMFLVDMNNTIFLVKVEKYDPLLIQFHQLFNVSGEIYDIKLSIVECYNKFIINLQDVFLCIYNRKFTNILKNISYENSIPQFYLQDKFNAGEYLKNSQAMLEKCDAVPGKFEKFQFEFSPNVTEKSLVYILSQAWKLILIRNFEQHTIVKVIQFNENILSFHISSTFEYIVYLFNKSFRISTINTTNNTPPTGLDVNLFNKNPNNKISISINGKIILVHSDYNIFFFNLKRKIE